LWLRVPFLLRNGAALSGDTVIGTCDPLMTPIQFCKEIDEWQGKMRLIFDILTDER